MISVPNPRQLLNGNRILVWVLMIFIFSSCGIFQDSRTKKKPTRYKKHKPVKKPVPEKVDTISWDTEVSEIPALPEEDLHRKYGSEFKDFYRVALILPLKPNTYVEDLSDLKSDLSYRFINYYGGVQLALEDLSEMGMNLEVEVINSSLKSNDGRKCMNKLNKIDPDLIIGPYERDLLKEIASYGKRKEIPVISPWQSSTKITRSNPYYVQLKPDIKTYYKELVKNVDKRFIPGQVYLIGRDRSSVEKNRIKYLQEVHEQGYESFQKTDPYKVYYVEDDSLSQGVTAFDSLFIDQFYNEIAVVIPNWSFRDEQFIYSCLRKLNAEKNNIRVNVYGMPIVLDSDKIGYNLYKSLNVKLVMDGYVDSNNPEISKFQKRYFNQFNALPIDDAFKGYDMMNYIGLNLAKHGTKFQYFLSDSYQDFLQTSYLMQSRLLDETIKAEDLDAVDYFENGHVDIWEFKYNGFNKMK